MTITFPKSGVAGVVRPKLNILISGAGIAGPCLAFWLSKSRLNASISVLERSHVPRTTGQSIDIRGPAIEIMKMMRMEEAVRAFGTTETGTRFVDGRGRGVAEFEAGDTFTAEYEILRADLSKLFLNATKNQPNINYKYGDYVKTITQTSENVTVTYANSSKAESFDLVVGADGSTSKIRSLILDSQSLEGSYNFIGQYLAFFSIPRQASDENVWKWFSAPKGLAIMTRPHRNPETMGAYLGVTMPKRGVRDERVEKAMDEGVDAQKRILREYLQGVGWEAERVLDAMDHAEDFYMSKAAQVKLPKWTNGRSVVIGDAALATFGVGTTLAMLSGYLLAGELSKIRSSEDIPQALERYEQVFRPIYAKMEELPPGFPQIAFPQTKWGIWLLHWVFWFVSTTKVYKLAQKFGGDEKGWDLPQYDWADI